MDDEIQALQEEYALLVMPGHERRRTLLILKLEQEGEKLMLGKFTNDTERERAVGRCQAFKEILDRDNVIREAYQSFLQEQETAKEEKMEGGDFGIHYEAAR